jgi:hypothetical protein
MKYNDVKSSGFCSLIACDFARPSGETVKSRFVGLSEMIADWLSGHA